MEKDICILTPTKEIFISVLQKLQSQGVRWGSGPNINLDGHEWDTYSERTVVVLIGGKIWYGDTDNRVDRVFVSHEDFFKFYGIELQYEVEVLPKIEYVECPEEWKKIEVIQEAKPDGHYIYRLKRIKDTDICVWVLPLAQGLIEVSPRFKITTS